MSIDVLQNKIRKKKNPSALMFSLFEDQIPGAFLEQAQGNPVQAAGDYCCALLDGLKDLIPAVRVKPVYFTLLGQGGMEQAIRVMEYAHQLGYYVILDWKQLDTPSEAKAAARSVFTEGQYPCDGAVILGYAGSDCIKPWFKAAGKDKDVYVVVKTANKSGTEIQDIQSGGRMVFTASADIVERMGETAMERCGYSRLAVMAGAYHSASLKTLRERYPRMFLLVDGVDESGCNAKNASLAFDRMGHGALVCAGESILGAWKEADDGMDPVSAAQEAAERMKRNLARYVTVL